VNTSSRYQEALDKDILAKNNEGKAFMYDFYFGHTGLIDIYSQKGNSWFKNIYKDLLNQGVTGIWGDLGEPEFILLPFFTETEKMATKFTIFTEWIGQN
jgi:alpha-glucosidase (family GH31 glycosyl hydrolase)